MEKKCNSDQWWNTHKYRCECKKRYVCEKNFFFQNSSTCGCENEKYLASIMDNSIIMCDEVKESYGEETNFNEKKATYKMQNFYILHVFY